MGLTPDAALLIVIGTAAVLAGAMTIGTPAIVRALPAPDDAEPGWSYTEACGGRFRLVVGGVSFTVLMLSFCFFAAPTRLAWAVLGTLGVLLAAIDQRTGYLPKRLTWTAVALAALAVGIGAAWWHDVTIVWQAGAGGLVAGGVMWAVWRLSRGLGFGDVRFAILVGLVAGADGVAHGLWALAAGALLAVAAGLVRGFMRRRGSYPFGPFLMAGPFVAAIMEVSV